MVSGLAQLTCLLFLQLTTDQGVQLVSVTVCVIQHHLCVCVVEWVCSSSSLPYTNHN